VISHWSGIKCPDQQIRETYALLPGRFQQVGKDPHMPGPFPFECV
jgi:hypothetical protein